MRYRSPKHGAKAMMYGKRNKVTSWLNQFIQQQTWSRDTVEQKREESDQLGPMRV